MCKEVIYMENNKININCEEWANAKPSRKVEI